MKKNILILVMTGLIFALTACDDGSGNGSTSYTVTFNPNGGSGTMPAQSINSGGSTLNANTFTSPDARPFAGWSGTVGGSAVIIRGDGASFTPMADTTLYALWGNFYSFNANKPLAAPGAVSGTMDDQFFGAATDTIKANAFTLADYVFTGWASDPDGNNTLWDDGDALGQIPTDAVTFYAQWKIAGGLVGETGEGGGVIFYDDDFGYDFDNSGTIDPDERNLMPKYRYLEAAPSDLTSSPFQWSMVPTDRAYLDNVADSAAETLAGTIGDGIDNTKELKTRSHPAAVAAAAYTNNGISGWFWPSAGELELLYSQKDAVGGFDTSASYWSSSENDQYKTWSKNFSDGTLSGTLKTESHRIRPIRAYRDLYEVGDIGPGGGVVFYDDKQGYDFSGDGSISAGEKNLMPNHRYLEAPRADWNGGTEDPQSVWSDNNTDIAQVGNWSDDNDTVETAGQGAANTAAIVTYLRTVTLESGRAAQLASGYRGGGKSDWFLPSAGELQALYGRRSFLNDFTDTHYWTSTEKAAGYACFVRFGEDGTISHDAKRRDWRVRPVRAF